MSPTAPQCPPTAPRYPTVPWPLSPPDTPIAAPYPTGPAPLTLRTSPGWRCAPVRGCSPAAAPRPPPASASAPPSRGAHGPAAPPPVHPCGDTGGPVGRAVRAVLWPPVGHGAVGYGGAPAGTQAGGCQPGAGGRECPQWGRAMGQPRCRLPWDTRGAVPPCPHSPLATPRALGGAGCKGEEGSVGWEGHPGVGAPTFSPGTHGVPNGGHPWGTIPGPHLPTLPSATLTCGGRGGHRGCGGHRGRGRQRRGAGDLPGG